MDRRDCRGRRRRSASLRAGVQTHARVKEELVGDGRRSGSVEIVVFDETAGEIDPGTTSMRESHPEQGRRDRGRQRQDPDPRLRPITPERSGCALEETQATGSSGSSDAGPLGEEPEGHLGSMPKLEARRQARLHSIHAPSRFRPDARRGSPLHLRKPGGEGDSRIERSMECSYRKSVADVGRAHLPQRGGAGRKA